MYLFRQQYVRPDDERAPRLAENVEVPQSEAKRWMLIYHNIGSWRKANHIHGWFVDNVQEGDDDCKLYDVSYEQLAELQRTVKEVLSKSELVRGTVVLGYSYAKGKETPLTEDGYVVKDPTVAKELLPRRQGCFFGSYEYDEYYIGDLKETEAMLDYALRFGPDCYFAYQSSW